MQISPLMVKFYDLYGPNILKEAENHSLYSIFHLSDCVILEIATRSNGIEMYWN